MRTRLPGSVQTVPRGELFALVITAELVNDGATVDFVTDNWGVFTSFNKGPKFCSTTNNCDLFKSLFKTIYDKALAFTVRWMPSHLLEHPKKTVASGVSLEDLYGNDAADKQATIAAKDAARAIPLDVAKDIIFNRRLVTRIQLRLTTIMMHLPNRPKQPKKPVQHRVSLDSLIDETTHTILEEDKHVKCIACLSSFSKKDPNLKRWLCTACPHSVSVDSSVQDKPMQLSKSNLHIGKTLAHHTHNLCVVRGLVYCSKCGCRAGSQVLKNMVLPCSPPTDYGQQSLDAIKSGTLPPNLTHWPSHPPPVAAIDSHDGGTAKPMSSAKRIKSQHAAPTPLGDAFACREADFVLQSGVSSSSESRPAMSAAERALPPYISNLFELSSLESSGIQVIWPDGLNTSSAHQLIFDFFEPMISREENWLAHGGAISPVSMGLANDQPSSDDAVASGHVAQIHLHEDSAPVVNEQDVQPMAVGDERLDLPIPDLGLPVGQPSSLPPNLQDLLELHEAGVRVIWPPGYDAISASQALKRRRLA